MNNKFKPRQEVYAVIRIDEFKNEPNVPDERHVTVKEIVYDIELAKAEVNRLNRLNSDKACKYFWQMTRLYPQGTSAGISWLLPWVSLKEQSAQVTKLNEELQRELSSLHVLFGKKTTAISRRVDNDDVLFKVEDSTNQFAVVHLTWTGQKEKESVFPKTSFYPDFEAWVKECMERDHQEYEA